MVIESARHEVSPGFEVSVTQILNQIPTVILLLDLQGRIHWGNSCAQHFLGVHIADSSKPSFFNLLPTQDQIRFRKALDHAQSMGEWQGAFREINIQEKKTALDVHLSFPALGRTDLALFSGTDISEMIELQHQLFRIMRMETIGFMVSTISHDLNNIFTMFFMSIRVIRNFDPSASVVRVLDMIEANTRRGSALVRQMVSFAKGIEREHEEVKLAPIVQELKDIMSEIFPDDIHLTFHCPEDVWSIYANPSQVHQVILNLCINARDAMENRGGEIVISISNLTVESTLAAHPQVESGQYVYMQLSDTGSGISPSFLDRIFEPFFTTKEKEKGTGLGLSTVQKIIKSHSGYIHVESKLDHGTCFHLYWPAFLVKTSGFTLT